MTSSTPRLRSCRVSSAISVGSAVAFGIGSDRSGREPAGTDALTAAVCAHNGPDGADSATFRDVCAHNGPDGPDEAEARPTMVPREA